MIKVGVIGLGMMGNTHLDVYAQHPGVEVVAISDIDPDRLSGKTRAVGNVEGQAKGAFDLAKVRKYDEGKKLVADKDIELVDICVPTPLHGQFIQLALEAGKHVLSEKPMCRTAKEADAVTALAKKYPRQRVMIAQCMRFWPEWTWLKEAVANKTYGKVLAAQFRRVCNHPGGPFYLDGKRCGGAILDLHIHDTDFIHYVFGMPKSVSSRGYSKITGAIDHVLTVYEYPGVPLVMAEGGWVMAPGFGFKMEYTVNFERATAIFNMGAADKLLLVENGKTRPIALDEKMGYELEINYYLDCLAQGTKPSVITLPSAADSVRIVEAEVKSVQSGKSVKLAQKRPGAKKMPAAKQRPAAKKR